MPFKLEQYFTSIIQHLTPFLFTGNIRLWYMFPLGIFYIILFLIGYNKYRQFIISESSEKKLRMIIIPFSILVLIYFFFSSAPYFYFRYTAFIMVLSFPVFVLLFAYIIKKYRLKRFIFGGLLILFGIQSFLYLHSGKSARAFTVRVEFVKNNFTVDDRIAAFQTGVLGYYFENVINLDGKMDNDALKSFSNKGIDTYIDSRNINVLMEWKDFMPVLFKKEYLEKYWRVFTDDIGDGRTICYVRKELQ